MVVSYSLHDKLFALAFSQRFNTIATLTRKCGDRNSDADDPRRLHPFTALAARHPCNLWTSMSACPSYKASAIQSELWMGKIGTILKCVPPQAIPCLYIMEQTKYSDNSFFSSEFCPAFRTVPGIVEDFLNAHEGLHQAAPWRDHQGDPVWLGTFWDRAWKSKLSAPTWVSFGSPQRSAVVFPQ